ncbi:hypothetical protein [Mucilaginibacter pedocola]|uniref:Uncharacterized protein n=1 Tax=Mucilaginibacter pedocola TaxID=1792845 RepID=A0A1S9P6Q2_9SPHI|nr:hypothetical protein [Mucilaginibacter pedocola]OOQ56631.1 hypothetical protein BC343_19580 [Mucilaginibacter pedocola]
MMRKTMNGLSRKYNACAPSVRAGYLFAFCAVFLALLWLGIRLIRFDQFSKAKIPAYIGRPSGPMLPDTTKHQK